MNHPKRRVAPPLVFVSNKYTPSEKSGILASISSRFSSVILVRKYYQIDYRRFNEPFADS